MTREEIERGFASTGWEMAGRSHRMIVGTAGKLLIRAPQWVWGSDNPVFELVDGHTACWVQKIPTPCHAAMLLEEHAGPREKEPGNPYTRYG